LKNLSNCSTADVRRLCALSRSSSWSIRSSNVKTAVRSSNRPFYLSIADRRSSKPVVLGAEADIQWADTGNNQDVVFVPAPGFAGTFLPGTFESNAPEWFGTVRGRLGFAIDRVLIYGTAGVAYTEDNAGWVVGGGFEWALPTNWNLFNSSAVTFGVEGLWLSIDRDNFDGPIGTFAPVGLPQVAVISPVATSANNDFFVARAKLNFKF
jgi:outer membrane immunogenic protein